MPLQLPRPPRTAWRLPVLLAVGLAAGLAAVPAAASAAPPARARLTTAAGKGGDAVIAWGNNTSGELGNGTTTNSSTPVFALPGGAFRYISVRNSQTSVALTTTGRVYGWGNNDAGQVGDGTTVQLGDGTRKDRHARVYVKLPSHTKITSIAAGYETAYAVTAAGRLLAWGGNFAGQLGDGTTTLRTTPVRVRLPDRVKIVAATA